MSAALPLLMRKIKASQRQVMLALQRFTATGSAIVHSLVHDDGHVIIVEDEGVRANKIWSREQFSSRVGPPLPSEISSSFLADAVDPNIDKNQLSNITRYLLQKLYGPEVAGVTNMGSVLYLDLPSNMVGSFLMGWWGVVLKADISTISEHLAIGLTTGYLGSLTTFSGWNQKMLDLSVNGQWVYASLGFFFGLFLVAGSILFGVATAKVLKGLLGELKTRSTNKWRLKSYNSHLAVMITLLLVLGVLLVASGLLDAKEFRNGGSEAQLWLACFLAPLGVWIRWTLARLNGRGIGKGGQFNWVPFGTLAANIGAASMMAALATVKEAVNTKNCDTVASGIQFGLLGCMSTVSTFMAEFHAMSQSSQPWRAFAYAAITIVPSFCIGILIYCIPVWTKPYN